MPVIGSLPRCLACPLCGGALRREEGVLRCDSGHAFDLARQGYASMLRGDAKTGTADTAAMVDARQRVQDAGLFDPLAASLAALAVAFAPHAGDWCVLDVGAGIGSYLARVLDALPEHDGVALDISKHAARRAARTHPRVSAVVADTWSRLPVADASIGVLLDVFAPRNADEFARVLAPGGVLLVATANADHLGELVEAVGMIDVDEAKADRLSAKLGEGFEPLEATDVVWPLALTREHARDLALMGPSAHHLSETQIEERLLGMGEPIQTCGSVRIGVYATR